MLAAEKPECPLGYPFAQLERILGDRYEDFGRWMRGQTGAICQGRKYNHDTKEYEDDECVGNPHGMVVYPWDLERYLAGLPVID